MAGVGECVDLEAPMGRADLGEDACLRPTPTRTCRLRITLCCRTTFFFYHITNLGLSCTPRKASASRGVNRLRFHPQGPKAPSPQQGGDTNVCL